MLPYRTAWDVDVIAGEPEVSKRMAGADWHYLRFPNLTAESVERAESVASFLKSRGYRMADVSVAFADWSAPMRTPAVWQRWTPRRSKP